MGCDEKILTHHLLQFQYFFALLESPGCFVIFLRHYPPAKGAMVHGECPWCGGELVAMTEESASGEL